ncbi:MAG: GspH/FimT family pseudopilin [Myxococcota bacterium]
MRANGFTLAELVLVIGLAGILSVTAFVYAPSLSTTRLDTAAQQVYSDIEHAKQNASSTGVTSGVSFVNGGAYTVYQGTTATPLTHPQTKQNMVITLSTKYPGISISGNYVVEFNELGAPTTGGGGSVTISSGSATRTITVTANTGRLVMP